MRKKPEVLAAVLIGLTGWLLGCADHAAPAQPSSPHQGGSPTPTAVEQQAGSVVTHVPEHHLNIGVVVLHSYGHGVAELVQQGWNKSADSGPPQPAFDRGGIGFHPPGHRRDWIAFRGGSGSWYGTPLIDRYAHCRRRLKTDSGASAEFLIPFELTLGSIRAEGAKGVLPVEDWAEIRRLHRAEGLPIRRLPGSWRFRGTRSGPL